MCSPQIAHVGVPPIVLREVGSRAGGPSGDDAGDGDSSDRVGSDGGGGVGGGDDRDGTGDSGDDSD